VEHDAREAETNCALCILYGVARNMCVDVCVRVCVCACVCVCVYVSWYGYSKPVLTISKEGVFERHADDW